MFSLNTEEKISSYLKSCDLNTLGLKEFSNPIIQKITGGDYNLNYKVSIADKNFLFRLNIEPQSGRKDQIRYEYQTLKFLEHHTISPRPYLIDVSKNYFSHDLLIEEYIEGENLKFSEESIKRAAVALASLHTVPLSAHNFEIWENPLKRQLEVTCSRLNAYEERKSKNNDLITLAKIIIQKTEKELPDCEKDFAPKSLIHTDLVPSNLIDTGSKIYIIDWEKGRIDDPSYDIAVFTSSLASRWDSPRPLNNEERELFYRVYTELTGDITIQDRVKKRLALFTLQGMLWAAGRIADVEEGLINKELGSQNYERYKRIIDLDELNEFI